MDKREGTEQNLYQKDLKKELEENRQYKDYVEEKGARFRVPYGTVREVVFTNLRKEELIDLEHAARLQYRLMLQDSILFAKVEFVGRKITLTYNPEGAENRKEKTSLQQIVDFLAKEGVHADPGAVQEKEVDYYETYYKYHFNPKTIREHPPYGYTLEEWKKMRDDYERQRLQYEKEKKEKFHAWQQGYLRQHPELAAELGVTIEKEKPTLLGRIFKKKEAKEKGFWFHGV